MGPHLICDKSTIQALSRSELNALRRYYSLNIPPVLLLEILADLKKADDLDACRKEVRGLAEKLMPACSATNVEFRAMVLGEMQGHRVEMRGVPAIGGGRSVVSEGGKNGMIFDEQPEDAALLRWQSGAFHEAEELLAENWRRATQAIDLAAMQRQLRTEYSPRLNLKSLPEVSDFADDLLASADQARLVSWFLQDAEIGNAEIQKSIGEIAQNCRFKLQNSLPFTAYCVRTALIFHFGLAFGLVSTRPSNRIDLEYFYYAPFCWCFSSGDNLHRDLAPHVFRHGQVFLPRDELKVDLKGLAQWFAGLSEGEMKLEKRRSGPPENEASPTHQLWKKHMRPGYREMLRAELSSPSEGGRKMMGEIRGLMNSGVPLPNGQSHSLDDCNFVAVRKRVRLDGPCICGSSLLFRECCGEGIANELGNDAG